MYKLIIFAVTMLLLSSICNGQGKSTFGATRAQDTSLTVAQVKFTAYGGSLDTMLMIIMPNGDVKKVAKNAFGGNTLAGFGLLKSGNTIYIDTSLIATQYDLTQVQSNDTWQDVLNRGDTALSNVYMVDSSSLIIDKDGLIDQDHIVLRGGTYTDIMYTNDQNRTFTLGLGGSQGSASLNNKFFLYDFQQNRAAWMIDDFGNFNVGDYADINPTFQVSDLYTTNYKRAYLPYSGQGLQSDSVMVYSSINGMQKQAPYNTKLNVSDSSIYATQYDVTQSVSDRAIYNQSIPVGTIFNDSFQRASLGASYTASFTTGSATLPGSQYLQLTGGDGTYNNRIARGEYTAHNKWTDTITFIPSSVGLSTFGVGIGVRSWQLGVGRSLIAQFSHSTNVITTTAIIYTDEDFAARATTSPLTITAGDTLQGILIRSDTLATIVYRNLTTGQSVTASYSFTTVNTTAPLMHNTGNQAIYTFGGTQKILRNKYFSNNITRNDLYIGNSITAGYNSQYFLNNYLNQAYNSRNSYSVIGGAGDRILQGVQKIHEITPHNPRSVFISLGVNDLYAGTSAATFSSLYDSLVRAAVATGADVYTMSLTPSNDYSVTAFNDTIRLIATRRGATYIDNYYFLKAATGTGINSLYSSDGLHPNALGHSLIAKNLQRYRKGYITYNPPAELNFLTNVIFATGSTGTAPNWSTSSTNGVITATLNVPTASASVTSGTITNGTQTIAGAKTFTSGVAVTNAGGTTNGYGVTATSSGQFAGFEANTDQGLAGQFIATGSTYSNLGLGTNSTIILNHITNGKIQSISGGTNGTFEVFTGGYVVGNKRFEIGSNGNALFYNKISRYNNAAPTNGQLLIGHTANGTFEAATLTAGTGITVTNGAGSITVAGNGDAVNLTTTSAGTLNLTSSGHYIFTGTTTTWTLPAVSGTSGRMYFIKNRGSGTVTINTTAAANEIYSSSAVNTYALNAGSAIIIVSDGSFFNIE